MSIWLMTTGLGMTGIYLLLRSVCRVRVSRVFYNDNGIEIPGLLIQRGFARPVFFPFDTACGFDRKVIYKKDRAFLRPMGVFNIVRGPNMRVLCLPVLPALLPETVETQIEQGTKRYDLIE